jgi:nucleoside recognition membrane protein YjiH
MSENSTPQETKILSKTQAAIRFVLCSVLGFVIFFVKLPIMGKSVLPIDWISSLVTTTLAPHRLWVCLVGTIIFTYFAIFKRKFWKTAAKNKAGFFFDCLGLVAFILIVLVVLGICPEFFTQGKVLEGGINTMSRVFLSIVLIMFFLPLLTDYGLPEFIGVFVRPICRTVWDVPGRVAVTIVSAFLGNFTVGHMQANMYYTQGKATHKEALTIGVGFATPSIGLILSICSAAGIMDKFPLVTLGILLGVLIITAIIVHIPPLSRYPHTYYEGVTPQPEDYEKGNIFKIAFKTGVEVAQKTIDKKPLFYCLKFGVKSIPMVANVSFIGLGSIVFFGLLNLYTPIFRWIGIIYTPLLKLMRMQADIIAPNLGLGMVSTLVAQTNIATAEAATLATRIFGVGSVMVILVFFGSFAASLFATKVKVKMIDFIIIYFERAYLTILVYGVISMLIAAL